MTPKSTTQRLIYIDIARFYAISLVFYGHFIERIMYLKNPVAASHYKFIYSFHMVLFVILSGFIAQQDLKQLSIGRFLKHKSLSRLLPYLFFTLLFMIPPVFFSGDFFNLQLPSVKGYLTGLISSVFGIPMFNVPTWFLMLIFSVELVHVIAYRFLKGRFGLLLGMIGFYVAGYWLNRYFDIFNPIKQKVVGYNYLFIHEAICLYGFYLFGIFLRRNKHWIEELSLKYLVPGILLMGLLTWFTYDLNQGPFTLFDAVVIFMSAHGHFFWFPFTAITGSLMIILLARLTPENKSLAWLGEHTLILMAMNGIFYHFVNGRIAAWAVENLSGSALSIFGIGIVTTVCSLLISVPLVYLFARYLPQLTGRPTQSGPFLKALVSSSRLNH